MENDENKAKNKNGIFQAVVVTPFGGMGKYGKISLTFCGTEQTLTG